MNIRNEFRGGFRQYLRRLGLPLPCPTSEIRVGELCFFNVDGSVVSLGNVLDGEEEEKCVVRSVETDIDPIISNGMRCHSLSDNELRKYEFLDNHVEDGYILSREKFNVPDYAILTSSLIKTEIPYAVAMKWINDNTKAINTLLGEYNVDPDIGLVLVLTQWSAPGYSRVIIPSNLAEEGVVMGLANGTTWVEGHPPEGKPLTLTMIEHYEKEMESTLFVNGLSIKKPSMTRRFRNTVGLSCYSGDREWKKHLSVKNIAKREFFGVILGIASSLYPINTRLSVMEVRVIIHIQSPARYVKSRDLQRQKREAAVTCVKSRHHSNMTSCFPQEEDCILVNIRNDFIAYRQWYGLVPPEHERTINLGDLGRFTRDGEFIRLGKIFESSDKILLKNGNSAEKWVGISKPVGEYVVSSEEMVVDPFVTRTTGWTHIPRDAMRDIKFLSLKRADRNSLTYEYVKPSAALILSQLKKNKWAHALLLGGPLTKQELYDPQVMEWVRLNSKSLRRQLELLDPIEQDEEYGLILVLTKFTSPGFTDVKFLNYGENLAPIIMGSTSSGGNGCMKWLRGYPVDGARNAFNGEFGTNEAPGVDDGYVMFLDGYSIKKASGLRRFMQTASDIVRGEDAKNISSWKKDVVIRKISDI